LADCSTNSLPPLFGASFNALNNPQTWRVVASGLPANVIGNSVLNTDGRVDTAVMRGEALSGIYAKNGTRPSAMK
jgi:hypothetical protein